MGGRQLVLPTRNQLDLFAGDNLGRLSFPRSLNSMRLLNLLS